MKVVVLRVSPIGNSCFIEPGNSARTSQPWPAGKAARLEILPMAMPDCALTKSHSMYLGRDMDYKYDNENIRSMLGRKKKCSPIWQSHLYSCQRESLHPLRWHLQKSTGFLNRRRSLDSILPSEMSSRNVEATPLVKRAWRSLFVLINVGMVFYKLKRRLGSTPPAYPKWFLLIRGFEAYLTANRKIQNEYSEKTMNYPHVLEFKREAQHMRSAFYDCNARLT